MALANINVAVTESNISVDLQNTTVAVSSTTSNIVVGTASSARFIEDVYDAGTLGGNIALDVTNGTIQNVLLSTKYRYFIYIKIITEYKIILKNIEISNMFYKKCLKEADQNDDSLRVVVVLSDIGYVFSDQDKNDSAIYYLHNSAIVVSPRIPSIIILIFSSEL